MTGARQFRSRAVYLSAVWIVFIAGSLAGLFIGSGPGAGPMPLVTDNWWGRLNCALDGCLVAWVMLGPALFLSGRFTGTEPRQSVAVRVGTAYLVSLSVIAVVALLVGIALPPYWAKAVWRFAVIGITTVALAKFCVRSRPALEPGERIVAVLLGATFIGLCAAVAGSPYASLEQHQTASVHEDLRDVPAYCRVAANFAERGRLVEDYYAADFVNGSYGYLTRMCVVPIAVTASFYWLVGQTPAVFFILHILAGLLSLWIGAEICCSPNCRSSARVICLVVLVCIPAVAVPVLLGSAATLLSLPIVLMVERSVSKNNVSPTGHCLWPLPLIRPEGAIVAGLGCVALLVQRVHRISSRRRRCVAFGSAMAVMAGLLLVVAETGLLARCTHLSRVAYDERRQEFVPTCDPWWSLNNELCKAQLAGGKALTGDNPQLAGQIAQRPAAFAHFLLMQVSRGLVTAAQLTGGRSAAGIVIIVALLAFAAGGRRSGAWCIGTILYVLVMYFLNPGVGLRHLHVPAIVISILALRNAVHFLDGRQRMIGATSLRRPAVAAAMIALAACVSNAYSIRRHWKNREATGVVSCIGSRLGPEMVVAGADPQLLSCLTGVRCIGGTGLVDCLDSLHQRFSPDLIVLDDSPGRRSYTRFHQRGRPVGGYEAIMDDPVQRLVVLQRLPVTGPGVATAGSGAAENPAD